MIEDNKESIIFHDDTTEEIRIHYLLYLTQLMNIIKTSGKLKHYFSKVPIESNDWSLCCVFIYDNNFKHIELILYF